MKVYVICEKVDGLGNDIYTYIDKVFLKKEDALICAKTKIMENYKQYLMQIKEGIDERLEALNRGSYITGFDDEVNLSLTDEIKETFDECTYGDLFIEEIEVV